MAFTSCHLHALVLILGREGRKDRRKEGFSEGGDEEYVEVGGGMRRERERSTENEREKKRERERMRQAFCVCAD